MLSPTLAQYIIIPLLQIAVVLGILSGCVAYLTLLERKIIAFIQVRLGPTRVGPRGFFQPIADGLKLFIKEDLVPRGADKWVFIAAPIATLAVAFTAFAAMAFGPTSETITTDLFGLVASEVSFSPWIIADLDLGLLYILAVTSLGIYGIILAGWASNSKYSLLGGLRAASQMISYEVPLVLALIGPLMLAGTLKLSGIVEAQKSFGMWFVFPQIVAFVVYFISAVAETNRAPFDLPEAESELVAGFHTEYSGMKFSLFFLGEYTNMIMVSFVGAIVFLGGWLPWIPFVGGDIDALLHSIPVVGALTPLFWLLPKVLFLIYIYLWIRATFPRYRYDQLMQIGWKVLIPVSLANILMTGLIKVLV